MSNNIDIINLSDKREVKLTALKNTGINVSVYKYGDYTRYTVQVDNMPNAENYFETTFINFNDILIAFKDMLFKNRFKVVVA